MNRSFVLVAILLALPLAGCFGYPEGTVRPGDTVTIVFDATDPSTGEVLANQRSVTFVVGSGASGLGVSIERRLVGSSPDETLTIRSRDDESRAFHGEITIERTLPAFPITDTLPRADYEANVGEPVVGHEFPLGQIYLARLESFTETDITYRFVGEGEQRNAFPSVGVVLVSRYDETEIARTLEPQTGAIFTIRPPSPFSGQGTAFDLAPGSYQVVGADDEHIIFAYNAAQDTRLLREDLDITLTVSALTPADRVTEPVDGNYGVRDSPQVLGDRVILSSGADGHDDDHTH